MKLHAILDYHMEVCLLSGISHILLLCCQPKNSTDCCFELGASEMIANCVPKVQSIHQKNCVHGKYEKYVHIGPQMYRTQLSVGGY